MKAPGGARGIDGLAPLALLPAALLAWMGPGALLESDPFPHLAGAGIAALALAPVALVLLVKRPPLPFAVGLWIAAGLLGLVPVLAGETSDTFEARRALVLAAAGVVACASGAALGPRGREWLADGMVLLSIAWTGFACADFALAGAGHLAGVLGNTGALSQAALPGAVLGAVRLARGAGLRAGAGLVAAVLFVAHAAAAPVLAGAIAFVVALAAAAWALRAETRARRLLALFALLAAGSVALTRGLAGSNDAGEPSVSGLVSESAGLGVRARIWTRVPEMLLDHRLLGVGPGQFQAAFPPYRDPLEAQRSRQGICSGEDTEVEHAHSDVLQAFAEGGLVGGGFVLAFLLIVALRAGSTLLHGDAERVPFAAAALATLVDGCGNGVLTRNAAASLLSMLVFGVLLAGSPRRSPWLALPISAIGLAAAFFAVPLLRHGSALRDWIAVIARMEEIQRTTEVSIEADLAPLRARLAPLSLEADAAAERAIAIAPDSVPAWILRGKFSDEPAEIDAILALRPHSLGAWDERGELFARAGDYDAAREAWETALALSAEQPRILRSLIRVEIATFRIERALGRLAELRATGCLATDWLEAIGASLLLEGRVEDGFALLATQDERLHLEAPEALEAERVRTGVMPFQVDRADLLFALGQDAHLQGDERRSKAYEAAAHLLFGRQHMADGHPSDAVRSFRQALQRTMSQVAGGALRVRCELAAAELAAGRMEDARRTLSEVDTGASAAAELSGPERDQLSALRRQLELER